MSKLKLDHKIEFFKILDIILHLPSILCRKLLICYERIVKGTLQRDTSVFECKRCVGDVDEVDCLIDGILMSQVLFF